MPTPYQTLTTGLHRIAVLFVVIATSAMILISFADAIGRKLHMPVFGAPEIVSVSLATLFFSALVLVTEADGHIRVGLLTEHLPARLRRIEGLIARLAEAAGLLGLTWLISRQALRMMNVGSLSLYFKLPEYPLVFVMAFFCLLAACVGIGLIWPGRPATDLPQAHSAP